MSEVAEVLRDARSLVERGWMKGRMHDDGYTRFCALGAIEFVTNSRFDYFVNATEVLGGVILEQFPDRNRVCDCGVYHSPPQEVVAPFNDDVLTTKDEVLAMFEKAIVKAEEAI